MTQEKPQVSPLRCITGSVMSGAIATAMYTLTLAIAQNFASKPVQSNNYLTLNLAVAVRTLVLGVSALATGIFAIVTLGLIALAIQLVIQGLTKRSVSPSD